MIAPHAQRLASEGEGNIEMPSRNRNATLNSLLGMARPRLRLGNCPQPCTSVLSGKSIYSSTVSNAGRLSLYIYHIYRYAVGVKLQWPFFLKRLSVAPIYFRSCSPGRKMASKSVVTPTVARNQTLPRLLPVARGGLHILWCYAYTRILVEYAVTGHDRC